MKKIIVIAAVAMMSSFAHAQVRSSSSSFGLNLGGVVSVFMENNSTLGLTNSQIRDIERRRARYEDDYNSWSRNKKHSNREIQYKRNQMVQNIRIEIENVLTVNQRDQWYSYDDRYDRRRYYGHSDHHHSDHHHKKHKKKDKHKNKHHKYNGKGHGHRHDRD